MSQLGAVLRVLDCCSPSRSVSGRLEPWVVLRVAVRTMAKAAVVAMLLAPVSSLAGEDEEVQQGEDEEAPVGDPEVPVEAAATPDGLPPLSVAEVYRRGYGMFALGAFKEAKLLFEEVLRREVRLVAEEDNSASVAAVYKGYSKRLAYLKKHRRVSLSALRELPRRERDEHAGRRLLRQSAEAPAR